MYTLKRIFFLLLILVIIEACQYKKEELAYPPAAICDTSNVRYSVEITAILTANCYTCHATSVANTLGGGNRLDTYNNLKPYAQFGILLNAVQHTPGASPMPKNLPKLPDCQIAQIRTWIRNGYLNN